MFPYRLAALALIASPGMALPPIAPPVLAPLFQDHAVLQREKPVPVWGRAAPGEHVSVSFAGQTVGATAGGDGRWIAVLAPLEESASGADLTVSGKAAVTLHDIVVGEVWLCSGQSDMECTVDDGAPQYRLDNAAAEIAAARHPLIRQFKVARQAAAVPMETASGDWSVCSPATVGRVTAEGYFFARDLFTRLDVPIGIINSTWAGSSIDAWMSPVALGSVPGPPPGPPAGATAGDPAAPSSLFNGMIQPLMPYAIRGALWHQGGGDVGRASLYAFQLPALIAAWRSHFGEGDFPFFWVQLASFPAPAAPQEQLASVREAQSRALLLPSTGQAVAIDIAETAGTSPGNRREVGRRLALIAKAKVYSIPVDYEGPEFSGATAEGPAIRVQFKVAGEGLTASGKPLQSFEVAGADRVFHAASAVIKGDTLVVRSPAVAQPVAVRYAWRNAPEANLYNGAGLPAAPFRSDDW
jgi:sialate O-acetylesterase